MLWPDAEPKRPLTAKALAKVKQAPQPLSATALAELNKEEGEASSSSSSSSSSSATSGSTDDSKSDTSEPAEMNNADKASLQQATQCAEKEGRKLCAPSAVKEIPSPSLETASWQLVWKQKSWQTLLGGPTIEGSVPGETCLCSKPFPGHDGVHGFKGFRGLKGFNGFKF